jgi:hypothetical protein
VVKGGPYLKEGIIMPKEQFAAEITIKVNGMEEPGGFF